MVATTVTAPDAPQGQVRDQGRDQGQVVPAPVPGLVGRPGRAGELPAALAIGAGAALVGWLLATDHARMAFLAAFLPLVVWLMTRPRALTVVLAVSLPFPASLLGGGAALNVAASDVLLAVVFAAVTAEALTGRLPGITRAVRPGVLVCAPYLMWLVVLAATHPSVSTVLQTLQRVELFLVPLIVGAAIALRGHELAMLRAYVAVSIVFAGLYPFFSNGDGGLGAQKNPAGQFIANALILLIAYKPLRSRLFLGGIPVLMLGLMWTQSRGSILSVGIALVVLVLVQRGRERGRMVLMALPLALCAVAAFALLPEDAKARNTDFSTESGTAAARSLEYREEYREEAWALIHANPVFGVGIGNYVEGDGVTKPQTSDPHNVLMLQGAEGGYPLLAAFVTVSLLAVLLMARFAGRVGLAAPAAAVHAACVGHGVVDVYWVRGTPVLGWLLIGAALGAALVRARQGPDRAEEAEEAEQARVTTTAAAPGAIR